MTDLCPICGGYWEHDIGNCAEEHGFTVIREDLYSIPKELMERFRQSEIRDDWGAVVSASASAPQHGKDNVR